jgi:isopentenyl diphosphate isomerase/L-lactate dehydrogenase-like FMN-dependent dehydrogenase
MKMVLKGILTWEDGKIAADSGIDAIIVSNRDSPDDPSAVKSSAGRSITEKQREITSRARSDGRS